MTHTHGVDTWGLRWLDLADGPAVVLLDQTRLPAEETYLTCTDVASLVDAIGRLVVRGAPLLGLAGAFGVALAAYRDENVAQAAAALAHARPTAVNLAWVPAGPSPHIRPPSGTVRRPPIPNDLRPALPWPKPGRLPRRMPPRAPPSRRTGSAWSRTGPGS